VNRISIIYVQVATMVLFALWLPETFATWTTATGVLSDNAITCIIALALIVPLAAGVFDLSVGYTVGASSMFCAWLLGNTDLGTLGVCVATLLFAAGIGIVNAVVVVILGIDSFIATLATGALLQATILIISNDQILVEGITPSFTWLGQRNIMQLTVPVMVMFALALVLWYLLGHTALGRQIYACGLGAEPARLAGIAVNKIRFNALILSSVLCGVAGILATATVSAGSPTVGPGYLIPAFAAAFLGATQFRARLFNAWGTVLAIVLLGTLDAGLALAGAPLWMPYVFQGVVLIVALAMGSLGARLRGRRRSLRPARARRQSNG